MFESGKMDEYYQHQAKLTEGWRNTTKRNHFLSLEAGARHVNGIAEYSLNTKDSHKMDELVKA